MKKNNTLKIIIIVSIVLCLSLIAYYFIDYKEYNYDDIVLKDYIIKPDTFYGNIVENTSDNLILNMTHVDIDTFNYYKESYKNKGYFINAENKDNYYKANNNYGYLIELSYEKEIFNLKLVSPKLVVPNNEYTNILPEISYKYGVVNTNNDDEIIMFISNINSNLFNDYVNKCISKGFTLDSYKLDTYYSAKNGNNYLLSLEHINGNIMRVKLSSSKYDVRLLIKYIKDSDYRDYDINVYIDNILNEGLKVNDFKEYKLILKDGSHSIKLENSLNKEVFLQKDVVIKEGQDIKLNVYSLDTAILEDTLLPEVQTISVISPATGEYKIGEKVVIRTTFNKKFTGDIPNLKIKVGNNLVNCTLKEVNNEGKYIDYLYETLKTDNGAITIDSLFGGTLKDYIGNPVTIKTLANTGYSVSIRGRDPEKGGIFEKSYTVSNGRKVDYYIYIPKVEVVDYYDNLPLIIQMQCCCIDTFKDLKNYGLLGYLRNGKVKDPKAIIVTPKAYTASPIGEFDTKYIMELINNLVKEYKINKKKITISGHSQGARHVLRLVKATPNYFAGVILLSWLENGKDRHDMQAKPMPDCPTLFVFEDHKGGDYNYSIAKSLANKYSNIKVIRTKNTVHGDVYKAFYQENLVDWMISQSR